jgi:hypothetical protein
VVPIDLSAKGVKDALFPTHAHGINEGQGSMMMMMFIGTETLVTQFENERSKAHATEVPATT